MALGQQAASVPYINIGTECRDILNYLNCEFVDTGIAVALFIASTYVKK